MPSMSSRRRGSARALLPLVAALLFAVAPSVLPAQSLAQTGTGSISGKVVDEAGNPLSFAAVIVVGKQGVGASTNSEGSYTIRNVPVGQWIVQAMQGGKTKVTQTVNVDANRTAIANFKLGEQAYKIGVVDVKGDKKMAINKTSSSTKQVVTSEDLHALPVDSYKDAIALKA
ncbi:MAG TPA: carboxypeptidase regulatory-like domain-containing protein, partial [Candidatus Omnitrophota bacterium]|nr:carboxypeptidase regulatory-like domain-containing protein [Candidatus Omnitrophota bacterium]